MAKLTRMQKYAGLREQMAHDREEQVSTNELSKFEDKLKTMQDIPQEENILKDIKPIDDIPTFVEIEKAYETPKPEDKEVVVEKTEEESFFDFLASLDKDMAFNTIKSEELGELPVIEGFEEIKIEIPEVNKVQETKDNKENAIEEKDDLGTIKFAIDEIVGYEKPQNEVKEESLKEPKDADTIPDFSFIDSLSEELNKIEEIVVDTKEDTKEEIAEFEELSEISNSEKAAIENEVKEEIVIKENVEVSPTIEVVEPIKEVLEEIKQEEVISDADESLEEIVEHLETIKESIDGEAKPIIEEAANDITPAEDIKEEIVQPEKETDEVKEETSLAEPIKEVLEEIKQEEVISDADESLEEIVEHLETIKESIDGEAKPIIEEAANDITPAEDIKEEVAQVEETNPSLIDETIEDIKEDKNTINNDFIFEALKEADEYNKNDGQKTIDDISNSLIDDIRHPEEAKEEKVVPSPVKIKEVSINEEIKETTKQKMSDDEFSNTVTLEIDKVLNEIKAEAALSSSENKEELFVNKENNVFEHPVLTKKLEDEPIEIKSMEETLRQDVLDDTIPFVIGVQEDEDDDIEDEGPNKVLNIILVILIIILVAILGVIVYFILFEKGIIGG